MPHLVPTAVFVSGSGTNLQAVIDAVRAGELPLDIRLVVSNNPRAYALERAKRAGIPTGIFVYDRDIESRSEYALRLARLVKDAGAQLVLLLGWMHVLAPEFLGAGFAGVLNLHPSYLPDDPSADIVSLPDGTLNPVFRGPHALRDAIEAKVAATGATLMEVTPLIDRGPVLARRAFALKPDENESSALERLHLVEQEVVREGIRAWIERNRARVGRNDG